MGLAGWNLFGGCLTAIVAILFIVISLILVYPIPFLIIGWVIWWFCKRK